MFITQKLDKESMRQNNMRLIFEHIYREGGGTRTQLAAKTGMSAMAVGRICDYLLEENLLLESDGDDLPVQGRPARRLLLNRRAFLNVGISLDVGGLYIGLIDPYGRILERDTLLFSDDANLEPEETLALTARRVGAFLDKHGQRELRQVGLVMPGTIDNETGSVRLVSQLRWQNIPVAEILEACPGIPKVILENDVKARAQAENRFGAGQGYASSVVVTIGSGIGAGIIIDHQIYRGRDNMAGEIGHTCVGNHSRMCECGRMGCLQATVTEAAIIKEARFVEPGIDHAGLVSAYREGRVWARTLLDQAIGDILRALNLLANAYAPEAIILCGSLIDRSHLFCELITDAYKGMTDRFLYEHFDLKFSTFGPDGNIISAATTAFNYSVQQKMALHPGLS